MKIRWAAANSIKHAGNATEIYIAVHIKFLPPRSFISLDSKNISDVSRALLLHTRKPCSTHSRFESSRFYIQEVRLANLDPSSRSLAKEFRATQRGVGGREIVKDVCEKESHAMCTISIYAKYILKI
ncbi:hypothetical protein PUN28_019280 [Cardiocondyla obscurior]|uniref:Uncharacterized protein n=1 Tax=Cardiocondyla obscurior TaxID=286306 RepID=A0AAW2EC26_9HYME